MSSFANMEEESGNCSSKKACDRIDPEVAIALPKVICLLLNKVLENNLYKPNSRIVASTTNNASGDDTAEQGKSNY